MTNRKLIDYIAIFIFFVSIALSFCGLPFEINNNMITFALLFQMIFCALLLLINYKKLFQLLKQFYSCKEVQMVVLYLITVIALGFVVMIKGGNAGVVKVFLTSIFRIIRIMFPLFFGYYIIRKLKNRRVISLIIGIILIIFCYGFVDLSIFSFDITLLKPMYNFFMNTHDNLGEGYKIGVIPRIQSFFGEPSFFALFIVLFIPIFYTLYINKIKIFKNTYFNNVICVTMLPLSFLMLILTQSPIYIIFGIVVLSFCYLSNFKNKKFLMFIIFCFIIFCGIISFNFEVIESILLSNSVGNRIIKTITSFTDINAFVTEEASLATRVISYLNMIDIFKEHPFLGCGCGNLQNAVFSHFTLSKYPLTQEIIISLEKGKAVINANMFFQTIAESGIFAVIFLYSSFFYIIQRINKSLKYAGGQSYKILQSFRIYMYFFILMSLYNSDIYTPYVWVMLGIITGYCVNLRQEWIVKNQLYIKIKKP